MKKIIKSSIFATMMLSTSSTVLAHNVAVIDMQKIFSQLPQMSTIEQTLQTEFSERRQEIEKLQGDIRFEAEKFKRESATMSKAQKTALTEKLQKMQQDFAAKARPLEQEIKTRQNQELSKVQALVLKAVESEAKASKIDEVKRKEALVYFDAKKIKDISAKIVERVSKLK
ncbi:OmpH family outer membrane protein [Pseudoalteromonas denitrificans]|uniref:Periplasmic chaperone for outer membrane proteins Skp n=1 Tax=Pseudoalteromonas denitrificans DSM 6059 TaxID=1123010 RepID=A0A1I1HAA5_9GAMM|nr:OmpH family outer membrane protein [Pseudoalteromonas denitrificans]SFC20927.1 periplasmic chaperone for outer membrane proteins Skp [Pseudoalteromonas denitrificans DSM 6059]